MTHTADLETLIAEAICNDYRDDFPCHDCQMAAVRIIEARERVLELLAPIGRSEP